MRIDIPDPVWRCFEVVVVSASGNMTAPNRRFAFLLRANYSVIQAARVRFFSAGTRDTVGGGAAWLTHDVYFDFQGNFWQKKMW